jgi:signal transduction histidine kinase
VGSGRGLSAFTPAAVALALFAAGAGLVDARMLRDERAAQQRAALGSRVADGAVELDAALDTAVGALVNPNLGDPGLSTRLSAAGTSVIAVAVVERAGTTEAVGDAAPPNNTGLVRGALATANLRSQLFAAARDSAEPRVGSTANGSTLIVVAHYASGTAPATIANRRDRLATWTVAVIDTPRLVGDTLGTHLLDSDNLALLASNAMIYASGHGTMHNPVTVALAPAGARWQVLAGAPARTGAAPAVAGVGGILVGALVLAITAAHRRARERAEADAAERDDDLALLVEVGGLLQRSLELAEILPALAMTLTDRLELAGCSILLADERGTLVESFAVGRRAEVLPRTAGEIGRAPDSVAADEAVVLIIERAGRAVGALWLASTKGLEASQLRSARALAELAGSSIVNARAFARERETAHRMAELDQLKSDFLGTVSHELRTPATAIKGFGSILARSWDELDEPARRDLVERIARNADSLSDMLNGLLDFARIERMSLQLERREVDLGELVQAVVEQSTSLIDDHTIEVGLEPGVIVWGDSQAIERIVSNLMSNAAKYSPRDTTIRVGVAQRGDRAALCIADEGPGVAPRERERIFSRFYRGGGQVPVRTRGTGIGLAVVKELVERLDATVTVDDAPGGGARFTVSFATGAPLDARVPVPERAAEGAEQT